MPTAQEIRARNEEIKRETLQAAYETRLKIVSSEVSVAMFQGHTFTLQNLDQLERVIRNLEAELGPEDPGHPGTNRKLVYTRFRRI